jgi:DNA-binding transcriptional LysR family regulator
VILAEPVRHRDLMYLEASAAAGTFTRAAKSLGINASTISRRVGRFEDELGLALFERRHGGVRLTSGGKAVLPHIRRALAELDAIRHAGDRNGTGVVGEVRLAVRMPPIGEPLHSLFVGWREKHPEVVLTVAEMNECEIQTARRCSDDKPNAMARRRHGAALPRARGRGDPS